MSRFCDGTCGKGLTGPIDRPAKPGGFSLPSPWFPAETADINEERD
jgi:hypothetical protein